MVYFFAMIKYIFWIYLVSITTLLCFDITRHITLPIAFATCLIYCRFVNGSITSIAKYVKDVNDKLTTSINSNVSMINEHTKLIKHLVPIEKMLPTMQRKVDRIEKETDRLKSDRNK